MTFHDAERGALVDALEAAGPDAPTLCEGWQSRHLAAHIVLRENSPLVAAGVVVGPLAGRTARAIDRLAEESSTPAAYQALVERIAAGPVRLSPFSWAGEAANLVEFAVHTEDVRRGAGPVEPLLRSDANLEAIFNRLVQTGRMSYRRAKVGVVLVVPAGRRAKVRGPQGEAGTVVVRGEVIELLLHAFGRGEAARIELDGHPADVDALRRVLPGG